MKILVLYHASVQDRRPGADVHIYFTCKLLSLKNEVTLVTWGHGRSSSEHDGNLMIIHFGDDTHNENSRSGSKMPPALRELVSYFGLNYILFLRNKGPSARDFFGKIRVDFDLVLRVSFNKNTIPPFMKKKFGIPVVEMATVAGLPHYLQNLSKWMEFIGHTSIYNSKIAKSIYQIFRLIVSRLYKSTLASNNLITVSVSDTVEMKAIGVEDVNFIPVIYYFEGKVPLGLSGNYVLFYSSNNVVADIAFRFILNAARRVQEVAFVVTGNYESLVGQTNFPDNLKLLGYLPEDEFRATIQNCSVVIFPLISGSGIQTKMLEALYLGKPIITTSVIASEFPEIENGRDVIIEDDPDNFVTQIRNLMGNPRLRSQLQENARKYYLQHFSPELALTLLEEYMADVIRKDKGLS